MMKKILLVTLVSSILILSLSSCKSKTLEDSPKVSTTHQPQTNVEIKNQSVYDKSILSANKLMNSFKISSTNTSFPDDYAGQYLDGNGILHVNIVSNKNLQTYKSIVNNDSVIFSIQKFSLNSLYGIQKLLTQYMIEYDINSISIMEQTNTVDISLKDIKYKDDIINIVTKAGYNIKCVKFDLNTKGIQPA